MYRYYLGSFGNKSFIRPQYEILDDGTLEEVLEEYRKNDFPNGGTVSVKEFTEEEIQNRLLKFRIDFDKDLHPNYMSYSDNSNQYLISGTQIEELDREEIINVIQINCSIEDFLNDKLKRTIRIPYKPNKLVMIKNGSGYYGPFEFMISDVEPSKVYGEHTYYTLKLFANEEYINKYRLQEVNDIVYKGKFTIRRTDELEFIYHLDELKNINPVDKIEFYDNEELAAFLKKILEKSTEIENLSALSEQFLQIIESFSEESNISNNKIKRISELLGTVKDLNEYKVQITEEYFKSNPHAKRDKEEYLSKHEEILENLVREDFQYDKKVEVLNRDIQDLEEKKTNLVQENKIIEERLEIQKKEIEKFNNQVLEDKKQEFDDLLEDRVKEIEEINEEIKMAENNLERIKEEVKVQEQIKSNYEKVRDEFKQESLVLSGDVRASVIKWAQSNREKEYLKLLLAELEDTTKEEKSFSYLDKECIYGDFTAEQIIDMICSKINEAGRSISKDEAYNYLISIVQNYITVFAGEPGTGKTSMCQLLAKSLGLYDDRFVEILVERGWTSSKDLIGYYNPLTKGIERTQPAFSKCMEQLDLENKQENVLAPYFVLLDEANLSPIEFYWSNFNYYCDNPERQIVEYSNGEKYCFGSELKFLATINYDQTTSNLSPRFLDRAWVISMNAVSLDDIVSNVDYVQVNNNEKTVSLEVLNKLFHWHDVKEKKINPVTKGRLNSIVEKMKEGGHTVSARSINAVVHYYLVAEKYMSSKEIALDYAILQKVLPCIGGNGRAYGEFLTGLMNICKENQLNKSANRIARIINSSEHDFYGFFNI